MDWTRRHAIGHGSTATVSLATSIPSGDVFAVKSTHLSKSEFLQREQKILSSLNSPHIVSCKGCDITSENCQLFYNLFMEYAPGGSLADMIHRHGGRLDESMIASYTRQILQGLEYLHSSGLVHCDIKGRNILIGEDGAKVADFGCAKWEAEERQSGGTPMFMAPEVARGEHQGVSSDIWALGCTVIEMASGGVPWPDATDPVSVLYRIAYSCELPEFPGFLSNQAKDFLSKCLRRDPKERWTATQLLKHPFLREFSSSTKQIQASNSISNSPTSILDQDIWNSVEESLGNLIHASPQSSVSERIRRLTYSDGPRWNWDERWMTIRGNNEENNAIMNDIEGKDDMICGSVLDSFCGSLEEKESYVNGGKLLDFLNDTISYRKISRFCTYKNDCVVISSNLNFQRDTDSLLIPSIKGSLSLLS
ncbi:mitogen-activated protein kinase kinase kinase 18-like [Mangifera indica]|uniref:mitogen-activated protein kinase kinase kinase 18-like n=1 Tax=Mangifera indica TaxID=29780 RepID=UPI001CF99061|nr:mitogen-activated protein kinase kinase kinase 18-like [Mangifera indica]